MPAGDHLSNRRQQHDPKQGKELSNTFNTSTSRSHGSALYIEKVSLITLGNIFSVMFNMHFNGKMKIAQTIYCLRQATFSVTTLSARERQRQRENELRSESTEHNSSATCWH